MALLSASLAGVLFKKVQLLIGFRRGFNMIDFIMFMLILIFDFEEETI
jgi:hypothetical protein